MTKREKYLLWMMLNFALSRYILINMRGNGGAERSDLHFYISKILCHYITSDGGIWTIRNLEDEYPKGVFEVHNWIARNITDRMDESIGFIIDREMTHGEQQECVIKFFNLLCDNINEIEKVIIESNREYITYNDGLKF